MHAHCLATFRRSKTGTSCPSCSKAWPKDKPLTPVGEEAAREGDDRKRRVRVDFADDNEEDETEDYPPNSPPTGKKGGRLHRRKANSQDNSMEVDDENEEVPPVPTQAQRTRRSTRH